MRNLHYLYRVHIIAGKKSRHPGNWLPSLSDQKRRKVAKKRRKISIIDPKNQRKNSPNQQV